MMKIALVTAMLLLAHSSERPEHNGWFSVQKVPDETDRVCCDEHDVYLLQDNEVRIVEGGVEALIEGKWRFYADKGQGKPGNTVLGTSGNPTGGAVAWFWNGTARCFAWGTMT